MRVSLTAFKMPGIAGLYNHGEHNYCPDACSSSMPRSAAMAERLVIVGPWMCR